MPLLIVEARGGQRQRERGRESGDVLPWKPVQRPSEELPGEPSPCAAGSSLMQTPGHAGSCLPGPPCVAARADDFAP